jgi:2-C-methyl-D-erythritol 4-phosphate cytidylyltransferase/2-C-methyl-D-erythritol 2,4-cyclodiphosphate synthase
VSHTPFFLVIPAAGSGRRMGLDLPKQYLEVQGKPLLQHTLESFAAVAGLQRIVLAVAPADERLQHLLAAVPARLRELITLVEGGAERADSVRHAVASLAGVAEAADWVLVHDAVRPCVRAADVYRLLQEVAAEPAGGLLAQPVRDTLKRGDAAGRVLATVDRSSLWQAATPQAFRHAVLLQALQHCAAQQLPVTDEAAAIEALGLPVRLVQGNADNIKLTWPGDLALITALLRPEGRETLRQEAAMQFRIGHGYDVHRFADAAEEGATLTLGGIVIAHSHRLLAHSDGDVLVHALCDALLGALALGDIGQHFPDTDPRYRGVSSLLLLEEVCHKVAAAGWQLGNADLTIVAQAPRMALHIDAMRSTLAASCGTTPERISVKATTTEGLGFAGRREGIACHASVLLQRSA